MEPIWICGSGYVFKRRLLYAKAFQGFLVHVIKKSTAIFVLEQETLENYSVYNKHTVHVGNSIVVHPYEERKLHEDKIHFYMREGFRPLKTWGL